MNKLSKKQIIRVYMNSLTKGKILVGGAAYKRMNQLKRRMSW